MTKTGRKLHYLIVDPDAKNVTGGTFVLPQDGTYRNLEPFEGLFGEAIISATPLYSEGEYDWGDLHDVWHLAEPTGAKWTWLDGKQEYQGKGLILAHSPLQKTGGKFVSCRITLEAARDTMVKFDDFDWTEYATKQGRLAGFMAPLQPEIDRLREAMNEFAERLEVEEIPNSDVHPSYIRVELRAEGAYRLLQLACADWLNGGPERAVDSNSITYLHKALVEQGFLIPSDQSDEITRVLDIVEV